MTYDNFYTFDFGSLNRAAILIEIDDFYNEKHAFLSGEESTKKNITYKFHTGSKLYDVIGTSRIIPLVSENVVCLLKNNMVSGWDIIKVNIIGRDNVLIKDNYYHLIIKGKCGPIETERSSTIIKPPIVPAGKPGRYRKGFYFDINTWDGSDYFLATNSTAILITKKVADLLVNAKIKNVKVQKVDDYEFFLGIV